jgi:hypothetical protein
MARQPNRKRYRLLSSPCEKLERPVGDRANSLKVLLTAISSLKISARNARIHSPKQLRQIARSIETFGFNVPVLVDADLNLIAGHGRIFAAQLLGWKEVPTICLNYLSEAQAKAFAIADNKLSENSTWNDKLLAEQLQELSTLDLDFSLEDLASIWARSIFGFRRWGLPKPPVTMLPICCLLNRADRR